VVGQIMPFQMQLNLVRHLQMYAFYTGLCHQVYTPNFHLQVSTGLYLFDIDLFLWKWLLLDARRQHLRCEDKHIFFLFAHIDSYAQY
jgi:hypothetical protein